MKGIALARTPASARRSAGRDAALIAAGAAALAVSAKVQVPIGPVPISAQTLVVLLLGALLGPGRGTLSVLAYLAAGAAGLPVFAYGGGPVYFAGPSGGYLVGFVAGAFVTGLLIARSGSRRALAILGALLAGDAAIFAFGLAWLAVAFPEKLALLVFLPGEALKIALAGVVLSVRRR